MIEIPSVDIDPRDAPVKDAAYVSAMTGLSEKTVYRRCAQGEYPHAKFGRTVRFSANHIAAILAAAQRANAAAQSLPPAREDDPPIYSRMLAAR